MLRKLGRLAAVFAVAASVAGCAEFNRRGGIGDYLGDHLLFRADTKSHRLLRSYVVVAALVTTARHQGLVEGDRHSLAGRLQATLDVVNEAYECRFTLREDCVFFDEKMARLDYQIYKLALLTLFDAESQQFLLDVRDKLVGDLPVVGPLLRSTTRAVALANDVATTAAQATQVVDGLLRLSEFGLKTGARITPLYRDALELDMRVILADLAGRCARGDAGSCAARQDGALAYRDGAGDLRSWRAFIRSVNGQVLLVEAEPAHFVLVSNLLWDSARKILTDPIDIARVKARILLFNEIPTVVGGAVATSQTKEKVLVAGAAQRLP